MPQAVADAGPSQPGCSLDATVKAAGEVSASSGAQVMFMQNSCGGTPQRAVTVHTAPLLGQRLLPGSLLPVGALQEVGLQAVLSVLRT